MNAHEPFADLVRRLRAGDQEAVAELLRRYEPEIRRLIRLNLTDPHLCRLFESADIFQSVFANFYVRFMSGQYDLEQPGHLIQLLATMARNKVLDHARKQGKERGTADLDTVGDVSRPEPSPSSVVANRELLDRVRALLTDEERRLAEQRAEGRTWPELAAEYGCTPDALRKKVERALDRVCNQLGTE